MSSPRPITPTNSTSTASTVAITYALSNKTKTINLGSTKGVTITYQDKVNTNKCAICTILIFEKKKQRKKERRETIFYHIFTMDYLEQCYLQILTPMLQPIGISQKTINKIIDNIKSMHSQSKTDQPVSTTLDTNDETQAEETRSSPDQTTTTTSSDQPTMRSSIRP